MQCVSVYSTGPNAATTVQEVTITLLDNCRRSQITIPDFTPYLEKFLWEMTTDDFMKGSNDLSCGPILYTLVGLNSPPFTLVNSPTPEYMRIKTEATLMEQLGIYNYYIEGCIYFPTDGYYLCGRSNDL